MVLVSNGFASLAAAAVAASLAFAAQPAAAACNLADSTPRLVYIGDSHSVGAFGVEMAARMAANPALAPLAIKRYAVAGSAANHWNRADNSFLRALKIQSYCDGNGAVNGAASPDFPIAATLMGGGRRPSAAVIALGTNDIGWNCKTADPNAATADAQRLLAQIPAGTPCAWIGPVTMTSGALINACGAGRVKAYVDALAAVVSRRCRYVDSRGITPPATANPTFAECRRPGVAPITPNGGDGVHFATAMGRWWAACAQAEAAQALTTAAAVARR